MKRLGALIAIWMLILAAAPRVAAAQSSFSFTRPGGEIGTDFDGSWIDASKGFDRTRKSYRQWIDLTFGASVVDPKFLNLDLNLRPLFGQSSWEGGEESPDGGIERLDGGGRLRFLTGAPVSLDAFGRRVQDTNRGIYGSRTDYEFDEWGLALNSRSWVFPGSIEYSSQSRFFNSVAPSGLSFQEDDLTRTFRVSLESSKAWIVAERVVRDDRVNDLDFTHDRANLNHRVRWGRGSSLSSQYRFFRRQGVREGTTHGVTEKVHIQHANSVSSGLTYSFLESQSFGQSATGQGIDYQFTVHPGSVVQFSTHATGRTQHFGLGSTSYVRAAPVLSLNLPLIQGVVLGLSGEAGYEWHDQSLENEDWLSVVGEAHRVGEGLRFALEQHYAEETSLVLRSEDGAVLYQEGLDYRLVRTGPRTEIFAFPGGRIRVGDLILADYRYQTLPGARGEAFVARYDASLRIGTRQRLTLYHRRSLQDSAGELEPGLVSSLTNYDNVETGVSLDLPVGPLSVNVSSQYSEQTSDLFDYSSYGGRGTVGFRLGGAFEGSIDGNLLHRMGDGIEFDNLQGTARLVWTPHRSLRIGGDVSMYDWTQGETVSEEFVGWGATVEWQVRQLRVEARADDNAWTDGLNRMRSETRLIVRVGRAF